MPEPVPVPWRHSTKQKCLKEEVMIVITRVSRFYPCRARADKKLPVSLLSFDPGWISSIHSADKRQMIMGVFTSGKWVIEYIVKIYKKTLSILLHCGLHVCLCF